MLHDVPANFVNINFLGLSSSKGEYFFGLLKKLINIVSKLKVVLSLQMIEDDSCLVLSQAP